MVVLWVSLLSRGEWSLNTVSKGVLKAKMLKYFRQVEQTGQELIVTDHRKPVLKIVPIKQPMLSVKEAFSGLQGKVNYFEDINTPTTDEWGEV
jgi:antitoxin (DNA-binding transcriptional repressor) of toxin-antitoxin stability system